MKLNASGEETNRRRFIDSWAIKAASSYEALRAETADLVGSLAGRNFCGRRCPHRLSAHAGISSRDLDDLVASGTARAFYDIGAGINERHSARIALQSGPRTLYRFPLPEGDFRAIQFHPVDRGNCDIVLHSVRIVDLFGRPVRDFSTRDLVAGHGISRFEVAGNEVKLSLGPGDNDPILVLSPGLAVSLRGAASSRWIYGLRLFFVSFLPLSVAGIAWLAFAPQLWRKVEPRYSRIAEWGRGHPRRAILILSVISVVVSCYPVVFLGRSFVSANIVPMLYPGPPTLPGHHDTRSENFKGSDTGAMMWYYVPIAFVQSRALARDAELPLWNRYNSGGVTLIGQGQSMFGDPLHILVVAAAGEAWAWDLKFLLAKILFCWGLGLAVYASSRHLTVALLLACSSAFIGFSLSGSIIRRSLACVTRHGSYWVGLRLPALPPREPGLDGH